jgi:hypothetical protein
MNPQDTLKVTPRIAQLSLLLIEVAGSVVISLHFAHQNSYLSPFPLLLLILLPNGNAA